MSAVIGQAENNFTPIQMAYYIATLANGGVKNEVSLIKQVITSSGESESGEKVKATVEKKIGKVDVETGNLGIADQVIKTVFEGMRSVTSDRGGTAYSTFSSFPIEVAGKTGTATASSGSPNAWFVGFAPYDDPEITITAVIPNGYTSTNAGELSKLIYDYYFDLQ